MSADPVAPGVRRTAWWLAIGATVVLCALAFITWQLVALEKRELEARRSTGFQESLRLALWRMDSALTPILAREAARPYFEYQPFYAADRAYTGMLEQLRPGEVLVPSPLLDFRDDVVVMHYQREPAGTLTSPQAPQGAMRALAAGAVLTPYQLGEREAKLARLARMLDRPIVLAERGEDESMPGRDGADVSRRSVVESAATSSAPAPPAAASQEALAKQADPDYAARQRAIQQAIAPQQRPPAEGAARGDAPAAHAGDVAPQDAPAQASPEGDAAKLAQRAEDDAAQRPGQAPEAAPGAELSQGVGPFSLAQRQNIEMGEFRPRWIAGEGGSSPSALVFERRVRAGDSEVVQGFLIDWSALQDRLLGVVGDLFPSAALVPILGAPEAGAATMLATIPAELRVDAGLARVPSWTPLRSALVVVWLLVLAALLGLVMLLHATSRLAERRGRFVTAVTHELRTPLTTFRLYSQMLAEGMVRDEAVRTDYLRTLERESARLAAIVESVLEYARLGRRHQTKLDSITVGQLADTANPSLLAAAQRAGAVLKVTGPLPAERAVSLRTGQAHVERILGNLVDNACKYGAGDAGGAAHVEVAWCINHRNLQVTVRDEGPGVPLADRERIFQVFERGSRERGSIAGLGLGLALSRELARRLGGDLRLSPSRSGAEFVLTLPVG